MTTQENLLADLLPVPDAAREMQRCRRTLDRWRRDGIGPDFIRLGRQVYYRREALRRWILAQERSAH